ncbi:MAG: A/G-specific adenine glycosylase [Spirochaetales bacterium]|nr:A/G-specific adenine glycosylase [Spirochaetales bacterium]
MVEESFGDFSGGFPDASILKRFQNLVLDYYRREGRDLPWRRTESPYAVLVSELMLQQTQVPRVEAKWEVFMERFPDFSSLAAASLKDVLEVWQGLGYNRRARALKSIAEAMVSSGKPFPATVKELEALPMIGPATARSIAVYAFNRAELFIETNVRRVFIHFFFSGRLEVRDEEILPLHEKALYRPDPRRWYNALMDYGTLLARETGNANRRSTSYSRQKPFEGSFRQLRGAVLRELGKHPRAFPEDLEIPSGFSPADLEKCLAVLAREGFLVGEKDGSYRLT